MKARLPQFCVQAHHSFVGVDQVSRQGGRYGYCDAMKRSTCRARVRGHSSNAEALKCPVHGHLARARLSNKAATGLHPAFADPSAISGGDVALRFAARPARGLVIEGSLTVDEGSSAEDCTVARSITLHSAASVVNCHSSLLDEQERAAEEDRAYTQRWLDIDGPNNYVENCSGGTMRLTCGSSEVVDCHADIDIVASRMRDGNRIQGCSAGRAWLLGSSDSIIEVDLPGQVLVATTFAYEDWLEGVTYDPATTFIVGRGHRWNWPIYATSNDGPMNVSEDQWNSAKLIRHEIDILREFVSRPKDGSEGPWLDVRNEAASAAILRQSDISTGTPAPDEAVALILALHHNP